MRSRNGGGSAAGGPPVEVYNTGGPAVVFRSAGSHVSAVPRDADGSVSAAPRDAAQGGAVASDLACLVNSPQQVDLVHLVNAQQQFRRALLACSAAIRQRNEHRDAHEITMETLMRRTAECNAMQSERDAALHANDARGTARQEDTDRAEGKKRKVDNSADCERQARIVNTLTTQHANMQNDRNTAIAARDAADQAVTLATQRAQASDLLATAAEHRRFLIKQELQVAEAELSALRRAGASDDEACCIVKDEGPRN